MNYYLVIFHIWNDVLMIRFITWCNIFQGGELSVHLRNVDGDQKLTEATPVWLYFNEDYKPDDWRSHERNKPLWAEEKKEMHLCKSL